MKPPWSRVTSFRRVPEGCGFIHSETTLPEYQPNVLHWAIDPLWLTPRKTCIYSASVMQSEIQLKCDQNDWWPHFKVRTVGTVCLILKHTIIPIVILLGNEN